MEKNTINIESGERLSFFKLFSDKAYNIEIPIIQRDYAQGRNSSSEVRETFLSALYDYLEENKPNRDLDFVYGTLNNHNGNSNFIPLDGQQRLTTLFLLHWYLAIASNNMDVLRKALTIEDNEDGKMVYKSKFTYETRTSSKEFCDALMSNEINFNDLLKSDEENDNSLSKTIQNCGWFYLSWNNDPTIQSMLTMLDALHLKFVGKTDFFNRLIDKENPVITFLFLNLKEFKLTDDLYIKMNARGMPLTTYENFKAKFEQHIGKLDWNSQDLRKLIYHEEGKSEKTVYPKEYFSHKIDTDWANLFWTYRGVHGKENSFDTEIMNFIRVVMANEYASKKELDSNLEFLIGTQVARKKRDYTDNLTFHIYSKIGILNKSSISYLIDALDCLENGNREIKKHLNNDFYFDENGTFKKVLKHELTLPQRVQFHAYLKYLIHNKANLSGINQWMRVIHNLTENTRIDGAAEVSAATVSIDKLIVYSHDIISYLKLSTNQIDFFYGRQVQEEIIKSHLITKSNKWTEAIEKIEKHAYFKGQIAFILEFSGVLAYYEEFLHCNWPEEIDIEFFNEFLRYSNCAYVTFEATDTTKKRTSNTIDYLWERAVLSKGDYLVDASVFRKNFLSTNTNPRDFSWKRFLRLPPSGTNIIEAQYWQEKRNYVKNVFDDKDFDYNNFDKSLEKIIKYPINDWRKYFINNPKLIEYCDQGFIRFESNSTIILYKQSQQNHRQREMYSYNLYLTNLKVVENFSPFKNSWHYEVKNGGDYSCAVIDEWRFNRKHFAINIFYDDSDKDFLANPFEIKFFKIKGDKNINDYPTEILNILESFKFKWHNDNPGFWISEKNEENTILLLKKLCNKLTTLES